MSLRIPHQVFFGHVEGQNRGDQNKINNPPNFRNDFYYWLRSDDRTDKKVLDLIDQENKLTENMTVSYKKIEDELFTEITSRMLDVESDYPYKFYDTDFEIYSKYVKDKGQPIYFRKNINTNEEYVLLDINLLVDEYKKKSNKSDINCDVNSVTMNRSADILSYTIDYDGNELYNLVLIDIKTNNIINHKIPELMYGEYVWSPDSKYIYYIGHDDANRLCKLYVYDFKNNSSQLLYDEKDTLYEMSIYISNSSKYLFMEVSSSDTSEQYFINLNYNPFKLQLIKKRKKNIRYEVEDYSDSCFLVKSNINNCYNYAFFLADKSMPNIFYKFIRYNPNVYITDFTVFSNFVVVEARINGFTKLGYFYKNNKHINFLKFDEDVYTINLSESHNLNYNTKSIVYIYDSLVNPYKLVQYDLLTEKSTILKQKIVPNYDSSKYQSQVLYATSHDNKEIPISMLYNKDLFKFKKEPQPLYLYGYGAYGHCVDPEFDFKIISLLDRGFIFVIAHVRGSSVKGYNWYTEGKMKNKMNTFYDFNSVAEYLSNEGYTNSSMIVAEGRSAGGLLIGSVMTMKPELYKTVILGVPFVDVLVTMCDPSVPLTTPEWEEWGNPNIKEYYDYMKKYSPIDNIRKINYPNTLITCGLYDPRVQYWEPLKFHIKLKEFSIDSNSHLIKIDTKGHFSNTDRYQSIKECAFKYAFILKTFNL